MSLSVLSCKLNNGARKLWIIGASVCVFSINFFSFSNSVLVDRLYPSKLNQNVINFKIFILSIYLTFLMREICNLRRISLIFHV